MSLNNYSIEFLKSGLSLNTHMGCNLGCKYCILTTSLEQYPRIPTIINTANKILEAILRENALFIDGLTPIYINNRTDPLLPDVIESTYEMFDLLLKNNISSPIVIVSKLAPDKRFFSYCQKMKIVFIYTYSGLVGLDYNSYDEVYKKAIIDINENVPYENRFHFLRPIIPKYNDGYEVLYNILKQTSEVFRATISGGLRINYVNSEKFNIIKYDKNHKLFSNNLWEIIKEISKKLNYLVLRHTSCALALLVHKKNNLNYVNMKNHCLLENCPNYSACVQENQFSQSFVDAYIRRITHAKYIWSDKRTISFLDPIDQQIVAFLRVSFGLAVNYNKLILSPSENEIVNYGEI